MGTHSPSGLGPPGAQRVHDPLEGRSPEGYIVTGVSRNRIVEAFRPVLDAATAAVRGIGPAASLYLYGSVSTGMAQPLRSDVDLLTIGLPDGAAEAISRELSNRFDGLCRAVAVGGGHRDAYDGDGDEVYGNRVFLRHYCAHLDGPDLRAALPDARADESAARGFNGDIGLHAERWRDDALAGEDAAGLARRIGRKSLFAVTGLASIHDGTWTTDRRRGAARWAEVEPSLRDELERLLSWGEGRTTPSHGEIDEVLSGVVAAIVASFDTMIGLWKTPGHPVVAPPAG